MCRYRRGGGALCGGYGEYRRGGGALCGGYGEYRRGGGALCVGSIVLFSVSSTLPCGLFSPTPTSQLQSPHITFYIYCMCGP